jgi:hypothetical protein
MSIQFNCPYCTAPIKVADDAAGKIGKCPKCETKLRVPQPAEPIPPPLAANPDPVSPFAVAPLETPGPAAGTDWPALAAPPAASAPSAFPAAAIAGEMSYARTVRRRRQNSWAALLAPLLLGGILVAVAGGYWWYSRDTMTGPLTGERLPLDTTLQGKLRADLAGASRDAYLAVVQGLRISPAVVKSELLQVEFHGGTQGLQTLLSAGPKAELVRVPVRQNKLVDQLNEQHAAELNAARDAEMAEAAARFIADWQNATNDGMMLGNTLEFRDSLGLNSLRGGLGYHSAALVGNKYYPCVHEDEEGRLYFAVPRGTTSFVVTERLLEGQDSVFPGEYRFDITVVDPAPVSEPAEPEAVEPPDETAPVEDAGTPEMSPEDNKGEMEALEPDSESMAAE